LDKIVLDQAEGLRRLLARDVSRMVAVVGGARSAGSTSTVANLAAALVNQGKDVLVIDERIGAASVCAALGVTAPGTLAAVASGAMALADAVGRTEHGIAVLPAPRHSVDDIAPADLTAAINGLADIVLIDAGVDAQGALSRLAMQAHDVVVVMRVDAQSITSAYACVKRLHYAHAIQQFRVLINGAATAADAQGVFQNLSGVASRYLAVSLAPAGAVAMDARVGRAQKLHRSVVDAFPGAAAAIDFRSVAADLLHWPWRPLAPQASAPGFQPARAWPSPHAQPA
jgi:flagellar biosynthesis protein FlhG